MALRAKFKFETEVFFMILRSKIMKNTSVSKEYSAAEGGRTLFAQTQLHPPSADETTSLPPPRPQYSWFCWKIVRRFR